MENAAQNGNVIRQVAVVSFAVLGLTVARGFSAIVPHPVGWLGAVSLAMLGWNCLSYVWSDSPDIVVRRVIGLLLTAVGAMGISRLNWRDLRTVLTACLFLNLVVGIGNELILGVMIRFCADVQLFPANIASRSFRRWWNDAVLVLLALLVPSRCKRSVRGATKHILLVPGAVFLPLYELPYIAILLAGSLDVLGLFCARPHSDCREGTQYLSAWGFCMFTAVALEGSGLVAINHVAEALFGTSAMGATSDRSTVVSTCGSSASDLLRTTGGFDSGTTGSGRPNGSS